MVEEVHHVEEEVASHQEVAVEDSPEVAAVVVSLEEVVVSLLEVVREVDREVDFPEVDVKNGRIKN